MIPRKKIQFLLCTICIACAFGFEGGRAHALANVTGRNTQSSTQRRTEKPTMNHPERSTFRSTTSKTDNHSELTNNTILKDNDSSLNPIVTNTSHPQPYTTVDYVKGTEDVEEIRNSNNSWESTTTSEEIGFGEGHANALANATGSTTQSNTQRSIGRPNLDRSENNTLRSTGGRFDNHSELANNTILKDNDTSLIPIVTTTLHPQPYTTVDYVKGTEDEEEIRNSNNSWESTTTSEEIGFGGGHANALANATGSTTQSNTQRSIGRPNLDRSENNTLPSTGGSFDNHSELANNTTLKDNNTSLNPIVTTTPGPQPYTTVDYVKGTGDVEEIPSSNDTSESSTSEITTTESFTCNDVPNSVQNLMVSSTSTTLIVSWESPISNNECILHYSITWYSYTDDQAYNNINSTESNYTISGLTSCTYYVVGVSVVGENGGISNEETISTNTTESQISQVNNLVVNGIQHGLAVRWDPPEDQSCLRAYLIEVMAEDDLMLNTKTVPGTDTSYIFTALRACTNYSVLVTPLSVTDNNGTVVDANHQKTSPSVPGGVNNLLAPADQITGHSVYLTWSAPTVNQNCVLHYEVDVCYKDNCTRTSTINKFYNASSLKPCLRYEFIVTAVGDAGSSDPSIISATTKYIVPGPPGKISSIPGQYSLFISWEAPEIAGTCVSSYRITLWSGGQTLSTADTNITISDLTACKVYMGQIMPISITGGDGHLGRVSGMTEASVNDPPLLEIDKQIVTESTISIVWRIDRTSNDCELKNVLTTCNCIATGGHGFEALNGKSKENISSFGTSSNVIINITVSGLSPFSTYECSAKTENVAGYSQSSRAVTVRTFEDVPSSPIMNISVLESPMFSLTWNEPQYLAGNLIEHEILLSWEQMFPMPSFCEYKNSSKISVKLSGSTFNYFHSEAMAYSKYNASIRAKTNAGWGLYSDYISFQTEPDVPGAVTNIQYFNTPNSMNPNVLNTFLSWQLPCLLNGEIERFHINFIGTREDFKEHVSGPIVFNVVETITGDEVFTYNFGELYAEYYYTFKIYAQVVQVPEIGASNNYSVIYPAGIPPLPEEWYMQSITVDPYVADRTSSTAWVILPLFENINGEIIYYAIMISEYSLNDSSASRFDISSGNWPNVNSWHEAMSHNPVVTYQATPIHWHPDTTNIILNYGYPGAVKFMLGGDESCSKLPSKSYCNGPLRPDTMYAIVMRAFTNGGYRDSKPIFARTKAEFNLGMVIGVVFGILFLGIITTMMLLVRKGVLQTVLSNILHPSVQSSPGPDPLTRKRFEIHCQELIENPGKLSNEFQLLQTLSVDLEMAATAAGLQANRRKNRYINILPYDISRVKLDVINNDPNSDYINASLIPGYSGATEYIACQGPKEETTYDFWRMIYQYNVKVIVMVTQLVEKGKDKCHQYYPNTRENFEYEDIMIRCSTQLDFVFYTQRIITLQKGSIRKTIMHLHFKEWSDHGVPDDIHSTINFCQIVRKLMNDNKSLAVIHCSAGVGRTGTLIAIDILLQQIKDNKKLDVFGTVYRLRQHRMSMVQTESQYAYIYNCAKQALTNPYPPKQYMISSVEPMYENVTKKQKEITDSNTNLVYSVETLKQISPSLSTVSMEPISESIVPQRPVYTSQLSTLSLRYSKSTSAIDTQISPVLHLDRCGSHAYPIFEPAPESPSGRFSMDRTSFIEFARPIGFETKITRATSINDDDATDLSIYGIKPTY